MILPIQAGDRPIFNTISIIKNIYSHQINKFNPFTDYNFNDISSFITDIIVFKNLIQKFPDNRPYFAEFKKLNLIFPSHLAKHWEVDMVWKKYQTSEYYVSQYEQDFFTDQKSNLYLCHTPIQEDIWKNWYEKSDISFLNEVLNYSTNTWLQWLNECKETHFLEHNFSNFSKPLSFSEDTVKNWFLFECFFSNKSDILDLFLEKHSYSAIYDLLNLFSNNVIFENSNFDKILDINSSLVKNMIYFRPDMNTITNDWHSYFKDISNDKFDYLKKSYIEPTEIFKNFITKINIKNNLTEKNFSHIKELNVLNKLLAQDNTFNNKILIIGDFDSGKTSLIKHLLNNSTNSGYTINPFLKLETFDKPLIIVISKIINYLNAILVLDNQDKYTVLFDNNIEEKLNCFFCKTIISSTPDFFDKNNIKYFDFSVKIPQLNTTERHNLSLIYFKNPSVSLKIAQRLKSPSLISKLYDICEKTDDFSWENISLLINNFNSVASEDFELEKWHSDQSIIPFVGYPELEIEKNFLIEYYKNPDKFLTSGAKLYSGMILAGPPGTGKTHFVRNISKIVDIPVYSINSSILADNIETIPKTFNFLRKKAPCIFFLDEIDVLISSPFENGIINLEKQKILNSFLSNVDGLENNDGIFIIGTTNRPFNIDAAAKRSGRLNKFINLQDPEESARVEIWKCHLYNKNIQNINFNELSFLSATFSCADIMEAANKATLISIENNKPFIDMEDLKKACDYIYWGDSKEISFNHDDFIKTCYHEAGHALLTYLSIKQTNRITVRPSKNFLGATSIIKEEGKFDSSRNSLDNNIRICLGGIAAETVIYGEYEQGGIMDLYQAKDYFNKAFLKSGFSSYGALFLSSPDFWSNEQKLKMEQEEQDYMKTQFDYTIDFLTLNKKQLIKLSEDLSVKKEISGYDISQYFENIVLPTSSMTNIIYSPNENQSSSHVLHNNNPDIDKSKKMDK